MWSTLIISIEDDTTTEAACGACGYWDDRWSRQKSSSKATGKL